MFASTRDRRTSAIVAATLVALFAVGSPIVAAAANAAGDALPVTQTYVPAPAASPEEAPTTTAAPVIEAVLVAEAPAPEPVAVLAPTTTEAPAAAAPVAADIPVEIGTACVIEADGTATGCE